jgi:hypothetical protein
MKKRKSRRKPEPKPVPYTPPVGEDKPFVRSKRVCAVKGCGTVLSVYNIGERCFRHRGSPLPKWE